MKCSFNYWQPETDCIWPLTTLRNIDLASSKHFVSTSSRVALPERSLYPVQTRQARWSEESSITKFSAATVSTLYLKTNTKSPTQQATSSAKAKVSGKTSPAVKKTSVRLAFRRLRSQTFARAMSQAKYDKWLYVDENFRILPEQVINVDQEQRNQYRKDT